MSLKLFRSTEFLSSFFSPEQQRAGLHPAWPIALASLWITSAGNLALWRQLMNLPELAQGPSLWLGAGLALMVAAATGALLSLLAWRWTLKPAIVVLLFASALGSHAMLSHGLVIDAALMAKLLQSGSWQARDLLDWRLFVTLLVLALLPSIWLGQLPLRRLGPARQLQANAITFIASCAVLVLTSVIFYQDFSALTRSHPQLPQQINPFNSLYALATLALK